MASAPAAEANGFEPLVLRAPRGPVEARLYRADPPQGAVIWVGGVGGGFDTPAKGLYPELAQRLATERIASLRVRFRKPTLLEEAVHDVLAGAEYLTALGADHLVLVGHSLGGAVVLRAAALAERVRAVVALAPQAYGSEPAALLGKRVAVLLVHGLADKILSPQCARTIDRMLTGPKRLVLVPDAGHVLDEAADLVRREVADWILAAVRA